MTTTKMMPKPKTPKTPTIARAVQFYKTGGPEVLQLEEVELPPPGPNEVQLDVHAIGLNRAESMFRSGQYLVEPQFPARLGYEAAGTIAAVGPRVKGFNLGDAVSVAPNFSLNDYGMYGDRVNAPASAIVRHPDNLSWVEAAAVWMQYLTAYGALIDVASLKAGDVILIPAASSSVGLAAIQIANLVGAMPIALTRRSNKGRALLDAGARTVIATEEQDLVAEVMRLTDGKGARVVFDPVGGPTVTALAKAMAPSGILLIYGALSPEPTPLPVFEVLSKTLTIQGYVLTMMTADRKWLKRAEQFINEGLASGKLKPVIAKTFPLDQIVDAHRFMESNQQIGKIVVTV